MTNIHRRLTQKFSWLPAFVLAVLFSLSIQGPGFTAQAPIDIPAHVPGELIVRFRAGVPEASRFLARSTVSGTRARAFGIVNGLELVKLPANVSVQSALDQLRHHPEVLYAEPNYIVHTTNTPNDPRFGELWGLLNNGQSGGVPGADIDAPRAWDLTTGSENVVVAVIDTGVDYTHSDLSANIFRNTPDCNANGIDDDGNGYIDDCYGIDTVNNDSNPVDDHDHGTHVAGTIGAVGNNALGVVGVNWTVKIMPCKFLDYSGSGYLSDALDCLEYVKLMKDRGVNIIATSNSWGGGGFSQALYDAIDAHRRSGILFIAAAGNFTSDNDSAPIFPAGYYLPNVISVAATDRFDGLAVFSNYGRRTVHIGAPGREILSTIPGNQYAAFSGTSMATPHVTGVAALLKAQDPNRDWRAIKNLILAGGDDNAALDNTITGKRLNALGALACADAPVFSRLKPILNIGNSEIGMPVPIAALHINCANANGPVQVTVSPSGEVITLFDDGLNSDQAAGDGIHTGQFTPSDFGTFDLSFPDGDMITIVVRAPQISVSPGTLNFGSVVVGHDRTGNFTVRNIGGGILNGTASTSLPFSIIAGGSYALSPGESQIVNVRFTPPSAGVFSGNVSFTGGGGESRAVLGVGTVCSSVPITFGETKNGTLTSSDCEGLNGSGWFADVYTFAGKAGQPIKIFMYSLDFDTYVRLRDPNGNVVMWSYNCPGGGRDSCIPSSGYGDGNYYLLSSGVYTIEATSYFAGATGNYTISLNPTAFTVSVNSLGTGNGYVILSGGFCGTNCTKDYPPGTRLDLRAVPESGSTFGGWGGACAGVGSCTLTINSSKIVTATFVKPLTVAATSPPAGEAGLVYNFDLPITGGLPPFTVTLTKGSLPPGLAFGPTKITGTPAKAGKVSFAVRITDQLGAAVTKTYRIPILKPLMIVTKTLKAGKVGKNYRGALRAKAGSKPYVWSLHSGELPAGLSFDGATGRIAGTPTIAGSTALTFRVTDQLGGGAETTLTVTIN